MIILLGAAGRRPLSRQGMSVPDEVAAVMLWRKRGGTAIIRPLSLREEGFLIASQVNITVKGETDGRETLLPERNRDHAL